MTAGRKSVGTAEASPRSLRALTIAVLLGTNLFVLALSGISLLQSRQQHELHAQALTQNMAAAIDHALTNSIDKIDLALQAIVGELSDELSSQGLDRRAVEAIVAKYQQRLPEVEGIRVSNARGLLIAGKGVNPRESVSWAGLDDFLFLRSHADAGLQFSKPHMGQLAGESVVGFSRRYNHPDGRFAGIVSAQIAVGHLNRVLSGFSLDPQGSVVVLDAGLDPIARYPALAGTARGTGSDGVSGELREFAATGFERATYHAPWAADGVERILTVHRLKSAPIMVVAGMARDDYLAEWYTEAYKTAAGVAGFLLLSLLGAWSGRCLLDRIMRESLRNQLYLHYASDGIHILDGAGDIVQVSDQFCAMLGCHRDELLGASMARWDRQWSEGGLGGMLSGDGSEDAAVIETRYRRKDGLLIDVEVNVARFDLDGKPYLFASSRDIGEKKRQQQALLDSEARLRQSEERYRLLLKNSPVGIVHYSRDLVVTYANDRFEDIMQVPPGYMLGLDCKGLQDQSVLPAMRRAIAGHAAHYEGPYVTSFGQLSLWISMHCAPVMNEQGDILGGIIILEDVTERQRIEAAERRQREGLVRLNEIAALSRLPIADRLYQALATGVQYLGLEFGVLNQIEDGACRVHAQVSPRDTLQDGQTFPLAATCSQSVLRHNDVAAFSRIDDVDLPKVLYGGLLRPEAYIGAPVYVGGEIFGTVDFISRQARHRPFDEGEMEFVGLLARWVGSAVERDQARRLLADSEARLQAIVENEPECVKVFGPGGVLQQINRAGFEMIEVESIEEANAQGFINFIVPEHRQAFLDLSREVFEGRSGAQEFLIEGRRGTRRWLDTHAAPLSDTTGDVTAMLAVSRDITVKKQAESALRLAASVFTYAHEGIVICDANEVILEVNPTFSEITGYSREEVIGRTPNFLSSGRQDETFYRNMWEAIERDGHWEGEAWNRRKDGSIYAERLTISSVRDDRDRITHYIGTFSDISILKKHQAELEHLAHYDVLTQLPNRALLSDRMAQALAQSRRNGTQVGVFYLDLDGFKAVNDELGHEAGDLLLVEVARRLKEVLRAGDTVARLGGDEFVLLLVGISSAAECHHAASRILRVLAMPVPIRGKERCVSGSLGITLFPDDGSDPDTLLRHADQAMYQAKQAGKNRYYLFDAAQDHRSHNRREALDPVRRGLEREEFCLYYQPIVDMPEGKVIGFEGLIRWRHPERGLLLPAEFLPLVEGTELEIDLGRWVLAEGLRQLVVWRALGLPQKLNLNVSAGYLLSPGFCDELAVLLASHPTLEAHALEIEILETAAIADFETAAAVFRRCHELRVDIALDDFGTGHSSLSSIRRLPVDTLKIDQAFVQSVLGDPEDLAIVESVVNLTRAFNRKLLAEGIENVEIGMLLLKMGCHVGQGYGIARPMPADQVPGWAAGFSPDRNWSFPPDRFNREDMPLFIAELEHRSWVRQMGAWLEGDPEYPEPPDLDGGACRFGQWYAGPGFRRYGRYAAYLKIGQIHDAVHGLGRELVQLCDCGRRDEACRRFAELAALRDQLVEQIAVLQAETVIH